MKEKVFKTLDEAVTTISIFYGLPVRFKRSSVSCNYYDLVSPTGRILVELMLYLNKNREWQIGGIGYTLEEII